MVRAEELSVEAMGRFVSASEEIQFEAEDRQQHYGWVEQVPIGRQYALLDKAARGYCLLCAPNFDRRARALMSASAIMR